ncbi:hypothetical protein [Sulfitobacter sp. 20_GPM-1509m]|uniref:hypothetical protein n=1 Tax=Sulfitobacter sp. 20_GPM-1509m TaxID=1380367 RepID=UPI000688B4B9|nr:hypothetical protein [Sulfitobacter sp. 20_GPM-1509m]|tara:strand:+ start:750 stop:1427 length:678 start_codon:yes stop_codon:yes gene_type:complete
MIPKRTSLWCSACAALVLADAAAACDTPVCVVDPDTLALTQIITFDDQPASFGPGIHLDTVLDLNGARFGERFSGQSLSTTGTHDNVTGAALGPPLVLIAGDAGQNLALVHMGGAARTVLVGYGTAGFPKRDAQGEGAIAVQFDRDQPALAFDLRGGEGGIAQVQFLRRDGSSLGTLQLGPLGEDRFGFSRSDGASDIAGFVLTNFDDQGLALDNLRFGPPPDLG